MLPDGYPRWEDDDDDGTLDPNDVAALRERIVTPDMWGPGWTISTEMAMRSRPLPEGCFPQTVQAPERNQVDPISQTRSGTSTTGEVDSTEPAVNPSKPSASQSRCSHEHDCDKQRGHAPTSGASAPATTAHGVPLLPLDNTSVPHRKIDPEVWNAFASNMSAAAAPHAVALLQHVQKEEAKALEEDALAPPKKRKKRRK
jgi:hypothetical protein